MDDVTEKIRTFLESCKIKNFKKVNTFAVALTTKKLFRSKAKP